MTDMERLFAMLWGWVGKKWYVRCPRRMNEIEAAKQTKSNSQSLWDQGRDSIPGQLSSIGMKRNLQREEA